jgi:hypothetical protein
LRIYAMHGKLKNSYFKVPIVIDVCTITTI